MKFNIRLSFTSAVMTLFTLIGAGTWLFHSLEKWTWAESFYFTVATLTTVGYGDIHPTTGTTRIIAAIFILVGVGVVVAALSKIGSEYLTLQERRLSNNIQNHLRAHHKEQEEEAKNNPRKHKYNR